MTKEDFEQLKLTVKQWLFHTGSLDPTNYANELKLKFIEPREKRIEILEKENRLLGERCNQLLKDKGELTDQIADIKANCDLAIEGRDIKIKELEEENNKLLDVINNQDVKIADLEKQIEKMKICPNCKFEDNDYMEKPCCSCSRCLGDIKRKGASDKWEIKENE